MVVYKTYLLVLLGRYDGKENSKRRLTDIRIIFGAENDFLFNTQSRMYCTKYTENAFDESIIWWTRVCYRFVLYRHIYTVCYYWEVTFSKMNSLYKHSVFVNPYDQKDIFVKIISSLLFEIALLWCVPFEVK